VFAEDATAIQQACPSTTTATRTSSPNWAWRVDQRHGATEIRVNVNARTTQTPPGRIRAVALRRRGMVVVAALVQIAGHRRARSMAPRGPRRAYSR